MSLRQKLINEVLDEDRNINRRVLDNLYNQVKVFGDVKKPQTVNNAVSLDEFFKKIDIFSEKMTGYVFDIETDKISKIELESARYNSIMASRNQILQNNNNAKSVTDAKIQTLLPFLNSIVTGLSHRIQPFIDFFSRIDVESVFHEGKKEIMAFCRIITLYAIYLLYRNNIGSEKYIPVDLSEIDIQFNKVVKTFHTHIQKVVALGLSKSPYAAYRPLNPEVLKDAIHQQEQEKGRRLTKDEELLLSIRVGGFKQFTPILTHDEVDDLSLNPKYAFPDQNQPNDQGPEIIEPNEPTAVQPPINAEQNEEQQNEPGPEMGFRDDKNEEPHQKRPENELNERNEQIIKDIFNGTDKVSDYPHQIPRAFNPKIYTQNDLRSILNLPEGLARVKKMSDLINREVHKGSYDAAATSGEEQEGTKPKGKPKKS